MYEAKVPERRGGQACLSSTGKSGDLGQPAQVLSLEWDRTARVPGPHWLLGYLSREHWGRKGLQDSGGTEFLEQLYTSTVPSETLLHISIAPAWSRIPKCQPKNPSMGCISWRTGTESGRGVAGSRTHSALSCCPFSQETKAHIYLFLNWARCCLIETSAFTGNLIHNWWLNKRPLLAHNNLQEKNKVGGLRVSNFKNYYKVTVIETVKSCHRKDTEVIGMELETRNKPSSAWSLDFRQGWQDNLMRVRTVF